MSIYGLLTKITRFVYEAQIQKYFDISELYLIQILFKLYDNWTTLFFLIEYCKKIDSQKYKYDRSFIIVLSSLFLKPSHHKYYFWGKAYFADS